MTYLFITHDLATVKFVCDRVAIMYLGQVVELGNANEIYATPWHSYTKTLFSAILVPDPAKTCVSDLVSRMPAGSRIADVGRVRERPSPALRSLKATSAVAGVA